MYLTFSYDGTSLIPLSNAASVFKLDDGWRPDFL